MSATLKATEDVAKRAQILSSPVRVLILERLQSLQGVTWSQLKAHLDRELGETNPNTLSFHLNQLIKSKWVRLRRRGRTVQYSFGDVPSEYASLLRSAKRRTKGARE